MTTSTVHIKLEQPEAIEIKRDILTSEMELIKIIRIMRKYKILRMRELRLKEKLRKDMSASVTNIKKLQIMLPKGKMPKIDHGEEEEKDALKKVKTYTPKDQKAEQDKKRFDNLEMELSDIQSKLNALQ